MASADSPFGSASDYTFPHLLKDSDGFVVHPTIDNDCDYSAFTIESGKWRAIVSPAKHRDVALEEVFGRFPDLNQVEIDLKAAPGCAGVCEASLSPPTIAFTAVYDVLFYTDWLFKFINRYLCGLLFEERSYDSIGRKDLIVTFSPVSGDYMAAPTYRRAGFTALKNEVMLFKLQNRANLALWRRDHAKYAAEKREFRAQLLFGQLDVSIHGDVVQFGEIVPCVLVGDNVGQPLPDDHPAHVLRQFVETHYPRLRKAFPVYRRLEAIFKLCAINGLVNMDGVNPSPTAIPLHKVARHVESVYLRGGIKLQPDISHCRKIFDRYGLACAFVHKQAIEDCYERAETRFLQCVEAEETYPKE